VSQIRQTVPALIGSVVTKLGLWWDTSPAQIEQASEQAWARARRLIGESDLDPPWVQLVVRREGIKVLAAATLRERVRRALRSADVGVRTRIVGIVVEELSGRRLPWAYEPGCWDLSQADAVDEARWRGRLLTLSATAIGLGEQETRLRGAGLDPLAVARRVAALVSRPSAGTWDPREVGRPP